MTDPNRITELDFLAYADGRLDSDRQRKAAVERYLAADAEAAARVCAYREQNEAIARLYGGVIAEPVPERILERLDRSNRSGRRRFLVRNTAAAVLVAVSALGGWVGAQLSEREPWPWEGFVEAAASRYHAVAERPGSDRLASDTKIQPLAWLSQRIAIELSAPDLSPVGFTLVDKEIVSVGDEEMIRLTYRDSNGKKVGLFLRPRWEENEIAFRHSKTDGVDVVLWSDGPLVLALATDAGRSLATSLAGAVERAIEKARMVDPRTPPAEISPVGPYVQPLPAIPSNSLSKQDSQLQTPPQTGNVN